MMEIKARMKKNIVVLDLSGGIDVDAANFIEIDGQTFDFQRVARGDPILFASGF